MKELRAEERYGDKDGDYVKQVDDRSGKVLVDDTLGGGEGLTQQGQESSKVCGRSEIGMLVA